MATKEDLDLGFSPDDFNQLTANDGANFRLPGFGDFRLKIVDGEIMPSKNAKKPHNMLKPTFEIVKAYDERNAGEVGATVDGLYGTVTSPKFMRDRFRQLCDACKVVAGRGTMKFSQLLGKEFDATIIWELSPSDKLDEMGNKKYYVNARVKGERVVGTPRPKTINPEAESQKAARYLEGQAPQEKGDAAPWQAPAETDASAPEDDTSNGNGAGGFMAEEEVEAIAHEYRAQYKLGGPEAEGMKQALIDAGVDPEGPINVEHLEADTRKAYDAKFGGKKKGLPALGKGKPQPRA